MQLNADERTELDALRRAIEEVGEAGWTTCMYYIKGRVQQITQGLPETQLHPRFSEYRSEMLMSAH